MYAKILPLAAFTLITGCSEGTKDGVGATSTLMLVQEKRLEELLPTGEYEASGVTLVDGSLRIVFDNRTEVASVDLELSKGSLGPGKKSKSQYEGITLATQPSKRMYVVKEIGAGDRGAIVTLDEVGKVIATESTDIAFTDQGKGLEGIAWLDAPERLLVLCEARGCGLGNDGLGVIKALRHEGDSWTTDATIALPSKARFEDFADLAVIPEADGVYRVAVLSQESSALWVGMLSMSPPAIVDAGIVYDFPKENGRLAYCRLEGVTFIDRNTFGLVSDRPKNAGDCTKTEAVHVFKAP